MKAAPIQRIYLYLSFGVFAVHLLLAAFVHPSRMLTIVADILPCVLLGFAFLSVRHNIRESPQVGLVRLFWILMAAGLFSMLVSQAYWIYYDEAMRHSIPSPEPGDATFLLAHIFFISAVALRPHSISAGYDLRNRLLDFALLTLWWFVLYGYFSLPWQVVVRDLLRYTPSYYVLAFIQHCILILAMIVLMMRNGGAWRLLYANLLIAFALNAGGDLLLNYAIDHEMYNAGSFYDTPFFLSLVWFSYAASFGPRLEPVEDRRPNREVRQSLWTARIAMLAILSLPVIALIGYFQPNLPLSITVFRLRLIFLSLFVLGALAFWKLNLLARDLVRLVALSQASIENLKAVQGRITQSQKLAALGRLAAGATHEISNPLTAILGYSELLTDLPALSADDRQAAQEIQEQVRRAQSAVTSLRDTLRSSTPANGNSSAPPATRPQ